VNESFPEIIATATTNIDDTVTCEVGGARIGMKADIKDNRFWFTKIFPDNYIYFFNNGMLRCWNNKKDSVS